MIPPALRGRLREARNRLQIAEARLRGVLPERWGGGFEDETVSCRRLTEADREALIGLLPGPAGAAYAGPGNRQRLEVETGFWMGAFVRGRLVGAGFSREVSQGEEGDGRWALFSDDFVAARYRRRGIARRLHRARLLELGKLGYEAVFVWFRPENPAALAALRSVGFEMVPEAQVPRQVPRPAKGDYLAARRIRDINAPG